MVPRQMMKLVGPLMALALAVPLALSAGCSRKAGGSGSGDSKDGKKSAAATGGLVIEDVKPGEGFFQSGGNGLRHVLELASGHHRPVERDRRHLAGGAFHVCAKT